MMSSTPADESQPMNFVVCVQCSEVLPENGGDQGPHRCQVSVDRMEPLEHASIISFTEDMSESKVE